MDGYSHLPSGMALVYINWDHAKDRGAVGKGRKTSSTLWFVAEKSRAFNHLQGRSWLVIR
jgi:hypothetical protein